MLTQVQRGESAPRVQGAYPQGLKGSSHGRNQRYANSSVNNPARGVSFSIMTTSFHFLFE